MDLEELDEKINSMVKISDKIANCNICGNVGQKAHVMRHIEAKHISGVSHSCELCGKTVRSRNAKVGESQN